ncbi:hypothetical protein LCGC14_1697450 [marine sediment metagenome]|uniref:Uncharacterized protein n=1 Tax=marine sediment metagenome TaxID=412755 RepID=A0A0F9KIZ3_9ZZZZ
MITGTILNIEPTQEGGYQSQNGYIYTFVMTIETPNGPLSGEIGSKTELYPVSVGKEITVNVTNDAGRGVKFKKINPQYASQSQPQNTQQGTQQPRQSTNVSSNTQDRITRGNAANAVFSAVESIPLDFIGNYLLAAKDWIETGEWRRPVTTDRPEPKPNSQEDEIPWEH